MKDLFGLAILDYQTNNKPENLITETTISDTDEMSVAYLFRDFDNMPRLEQTALELANGKILDVGCGAGSHSLYLQNHKNLKVHSIDISANAIKACQLRGLKNASVQDIMRCEGDKFDTILLLMNGAGMCGTLNRLPQFLTKLKSLLTENGQVLLDSSDIIYMFDEDENGAKILPFTDKYYGEVSFNISYKNIRETSFKWMYIDYKTLENAALSIGLKCEKVQDGDHFDYLARLY